MADLFELLYISALVWMMHQGERSLGLLDVARAGRLFNSQDHVEIRGAAKHHGDQRLTSRDVFSNAEA